MREASSLVLAARLLAEGAQVRAYDPVAEKEARKLMAGVSFADSTAAWQALLGRGVLVRDVGLPGWLRVTAGTAAEVDAFLTALAEVGATSAGVTG